MWEAGSLDREPGEAAQADPLHEDRHQEGMFRQRYPLFWWLTLLGPFVVTAGILAYLWLDQGPQFVWRLLGIATATFFFFGKFVILGGGDGERVAAHALLSSRALFFMVVYMDLLTASLVVFHLGFLFKLPLVGPKLEALADDGKFILQSNPWMKRATAIGLVAFVMFPLAATGSVGGSIFGRLLGMSRLATLICITIGSLLGCALMYYGSHLINTYLDRDSLALQIGGAVCIAALIFWLNHRYRQLKARHAQIHAADKEGSTGQK